MAGKGVAFLKKSISISLLTIASLVASLPRQSQGLPLPVPVTSAQGIFTPNASWITARPTPTPQQEHLNLRLARVRRFRRRLEMAFRVMLTPAYMADPSAGLELKMLPLFGPHLSRDPDPLVHPPA